jgi:hypothetical protein
MSKLTNYAEFPRAVALPIKFSQSSLVLLSNRSSILIAVQMHALSSTVMISALSSVTNPNSRKSSLMSARHLNSSICVWTSPNLNYSASETASSIK